MEAEKNPITTELAKNNVTDAVIANLKKVYLPLKINGIDDKDGYKRVHDARIVCRDTRVLAEKICKKGREDAIKEQKMWISKEKEVVAQITEVESYLKKQEDAIDTEKENIRIRGERLLKLPGRKEESLGMQNYFTMELTDENIMSFTDVDWTQLLLMAKSRKLDEQQKVIDDANEIKLNGRINELFAVGAMPQKGSGEVTYKKGSVCVTEQTIKECPDEEWPKIIEGFQNATIPEKTGISYKPGVTARIEPLPQQQEMGDEEKLFHYASLLENIPVPSMKTKEGKDTLALAMDLLTQTINLLRQ